MRKNMKFGMAAVFVAATALSLVGCGPQPTPAAATSATLVAHFTEDAQSGTPKCVSDLEWDYTPSSGRPTQNIRKDATATVDTRTTTCTFSDQAVTLPIGTVGVKLIDGTTVVANCTGLQLKAQTYNIDLATCKLT